MSTVSMSGQDARDVIGRAIHEHDANACMGGVEWPTWDDLDDEGRAAYEPVGDAVLDALTDAGFAVVKLPDGKRDHWGEWLWPVRSTRGGCSMITVHGDVALLGVPSPYSPADAPAIAAAILAAAAHAEAGEHRG